MRRRSWRAERIFSGVEHHAADQAFGELVAHGLDPRSRSSDPEKPTMMVWPIIRSRRSSANAVSRQRGEAIRLGGAGKWGAEHETLKLPAARNKAESRIASWVQHLWRFLNAAPPVSVAPLSVEKLTDDNNSSVLW